MIYDGFTKEKWMNGLGGMDDHNVRHILAAFALLGVPHSYLDVGCGTGAMVKAAARLGVRAYGVDQLVDETWGPNFYHKNLVDKFVLPEGPVELVTTFEVGEHLHESAHATFCDTLADNLAAGHHYLLFTAARPGQGGTYHLAERPTAYWHEQFQLRGMSFNLDLTMALALIWSNIRTPLSYMWDNLIVFERG